MKNIHFESIGSALTILFKFLLFSLIFIPNSVLFSQTLSCGLDDSKIPQDIKKIMSSLNSASKSRLKNDQLYICNLAIGIDSQTFEEFGKDSLKIMNEVAKQVEEVSKITEKDLSIKLYLKKLHIWKEKIADPFLNVSNIFEAINILHSQSALLSSDIDVVMYLPTKALCSLIYF